MRFVKRGKDRLFEVWQIAILILLFLGHMNVKNLYFYFIFGTAIIFILVNYRCVKIDKIFIILLLFSFCYILFYPNARNSITTVLKHILYPLCYLFGMNFIREKDKLVEERVEQKVSITMVICVLGVFLHYMLNMIINFNSLDRNNKDFWTGEVVSATGQAALAVLAVGVFSAWLFDRKKNKVIAVCGLLLIMAYNLILAGRTLILITVVVLGIAFIFTVCKSSSEKKKRLWISTLSIPLLMILAYVQNWFGLREFILGSNLFMRFDSMDFNHDQRLLHKFQYLIHMLDHPFGGDTLYNAVGEYAHELYLDVYSNAGVLAYILVILFSAISFFLVFRVIARGKTSNDFKVLVLCLFLTFFMEFFLEPILQGLPWMFCLFCYMIGLIRNIELEEKWPVRNQVNK